MATTALAAGCQMTPAEPGGHAESTAAFAPAALRIHPLTHIDAAKSTPDKPAADKSFIILHFELKDRFGDAVKALGQLDVELTKPGVGIAPGMETRELSWTVKELSNPEQNVDRFDPPTRTYRIVLSGPKWIADWANRPESAKREGPAWLKLRAVMQLEGGGSLRDEYVLQ